MENRNPNTHLTVKERNRESFPTRFLFENNLLKGKILDFGCGLGEDVKFLLEKGFETTAYDKHYFPDYPQEKYDIILCHYVLNVLLPEEQTTVLMEISQLIQEGGRAFFTVRRDVKKNDFIFNPKRQVKVYQCNVKLPFKSVLKTEHCEIYEYTPYCTHTSKNPDCLFCSFERKIICENVSTFAVYDRFPVSNGHVLIIPKRHSENYFEMSQKEQISAWLMVNFIKSYIQKKYNVENFNVGFNVGTAAGQTIFHTHIHVIPRYSGDTPFPRGGVRNVISGHGHY
jgi:diadenosine tetraphosphate (Ap4A) HIT family hydrolase